MADRTLRARLLGPFAVLVDGRQLSHAAFERPSGLRLLKLILATPGHRIRREDAAERLWPEADPERSGANLRKAIHFARAALRTVGAEEVLVAAGDQLTLAEHVRLEIDADRLATVITKVEAPSGEPADLAVLRALAELAGEDLLSDDPYEEWAVPIRERLRERTRAALLRAAGRARELGERDLAFAIVDRALQLDVADEEAHRLAIQLHLDAGAAHAARRQLEAARTALAEAYGIEPSPDLQALVARASVASSSADRAPAPAPIIGRRREIDALGALFDRAIAGHLGAVVIRGPAGIGKTRLLAELERELAASSWTILRARGLESAAAIPFGGVAQLLHAVPNGHWSDWPEPARSAVLALGVADGQPGIAFASDEALSAGVVDALARVVRAGGQVALSIDDVQWLDVQSVSCLGGMLGALAGLPALVAMTMRELDSPAVPVLSLLEDIRRVEGLDLRIEPLGPRELQLVVERDAGDGARLDGPLATWLFERSAGVPLFALELFRGLRADGACDLREGRWTLARRPPDLLPRSVGLLVDGRLARLEERVRDVLATAGEIGDEVEFEALRTATGADAGATLDALEAGMRAGLMVESAGHYRFAHPLFRAALRKGVPARRRPAMHLQVATALASGIDPRDGLALDAAANRVNLLAVAHHAATAAELGEPAALPWAVGFGFAAGMRQADLFDFDGAVATLDRAVSLWYRLPESDRGSFPVSRALVALGWAHHGRNDRAAASEAFLGAARAASTDGERARAWGAAAWMPYQQGRFDAADELLEQGLQSIADPVARAVLLADRGWIVGRLGRWRDSRRLLEDAVAVLERGAVPDVLTRALDRLGVAIRDTGEPAVALSVFDRAIRLASDGHDSKLQAAIGEHVAGALRMLGRLDEARSTVLGAIEFARMSGDRYMESVSEWIASEVDHSAGDLASARRRRQRELEILTDIGGNPQNEALAHAHLAHLARLLGDVPGAAAASDAARAVARHAGIPLLERRVEAALAASDWFNAGAHTEAGVHDDERESGAIAST